MQVEEVIHNSRLYSILVKERALDQEEHEFFSPWSRHAVLSEIKSVQRSLSRKFSTLRKRRRRKEDDCDNNNTSAITKCHSNQIRVTISPDTTEHDNDEAGDSGDSGPVVNCSLSRLFGSFRSSHKTRDDAVTGGDEAGEVVSKEAVTKTGDISHDEIVSGRDSAYFSLTLASDDSLADEAAEADHRVHDESGDSLLVSGRKHQASQTEPKKNVTLVLPDTSTPDKPFGIHLQTQTVKIKKQSPGNIRPGPDGNISCQLDTIILQAKIHLLSRFPKYNVTINIIFSPSRKYFMNLSSSLIGDLIHQLNRILFSPLLVSLKTWEVTLFMIIKFLHTLITFLHYSGLCHNIDVQCVKFFNSCLLNEFCDYETEHVLARVQQEFIGIWMSLIL